jgi:hypothetical protein
MVNDEGCEDVVSAGNVTTAVVNEQASHPGRDENR